MCSRIYDVVSKLSQVERGGLTKQQATARVVNDFIHGSLSDVESLERSGQRMYTAAVTQHGKKVAAAKESLRKGSKTAGATLAALQCVLYECQYGATIYQSKVAPVPVPVATPLADEVRKLRQDVHSLRTETILLKQQPDVAMRERKRTAAAQIEAAAAQSEAAAARAEASSALEQLK
eukprot:6983600-Prymnesium_polylepis.1